MAEHALPIELEELAEVLGERHGPAFSRLARIYTALQRAQVQDSLSDLRFCYAALDPDAEATLRQAPSAAEAVDRRERLQVMLEEFLRRANYLRLSTEELDLALTRVSPRGLAVAVDLGAYEELGLFYRGLHERTDRTRDWRRLWLRDREWQTPVYRRLFLMIKLKPRPGREEEARFLYLKLFRDVPQSDLEMLLPDTKVRMRLFDKLRLGVTGGGGAAGGIAATMTKLGAAANPTTWAIALAGLAGVLWRQVAKVFTTRTRYMADLAKQLYFCNLDNNFGAMTHLVEQAQLEESKEALLAYAHLLAAPDGLTAAALDRAVEEDLKQSFGLDVDYEVEDGLAKLERAGLLRRQGPRLSVVPPEEAFARLDREWDDMFQPLAD